MRFFHTRSAATLAALMLLATAGLASAAQFGLGLTRVHLDASRHTETVTMTNQDTRPLAFEVQLKRWHQDEDGTWQLGPVAPEEGLIVHPLILRVEPGQTTRLRIGSLSPSVAREAAYRLELAEIPDRTEQKAGTVRMMARVSMPVFVQPPDARATVALSVDHIDAATAQLVLRNTGTAYAAPGDATFRVRDTAGQIVHEARVTSNYVLAGAQWPLQAGLPAGACARAAAIELQYDDAAPLIATIAPGMRRCAQ